MNDNVTWDLCFYLLKPIKRSSDVNVIVEDDISSLITRSGEHNSFWQKTLINGDDTQRLHNDDALARWLVKDMSQN